MPLSQRMIFSFPPAMMYSALMSSSLIVFASPLLSKMVFLVFPSSFRTSPYDFQGMKAEGIELLLEAKKATGLPIVTEIMNANHLPLFEEFTRFA